MISVRLTELNSNAVVAVVGVNILVVVQRSTFNSSLVQVEKKIVSHRFTSHVVNFANCRGTLASHLTRLRNSARATTLLIFFFVINRL